MWLRGDARWTRRLGDVRNLLSMPNASRSVWSKDCNLWGGINDKVVLAGRIAAETIFALYDMFFQAPALTCAWNAEVFIKKVATAKGLRHELLPHQQLPFGDAMYIGSPTQYCFL